MRVRNIVLIGWVVACGPEVSSRPPLVTPTASSSAALAPPPAPRSDGRLPALATPVRYAVTLDVDPKAQTFAGTVEIMIDVPVETAHVVINAKDVTVKRAEARVGDAALALHTTTRASHGALEPDELVLSADRAIPKGRSTLVIDYEAPFGRQLSGLYRAEDGSESYAFTQFEAADARRAFPCFDEPGFKTPFDVTLTVPTGLLGLSNGVETSRTPNGAKTTFKFTTTPPIPTYLVAFAVGNFDVVDGPKTPTPIRFITTHGRGALSASAMRAGADMVPLLAKYFGIAFPYEKLDLVAVPDFGAGGMENAGFITFRDDLVLLDEHASARQKRGMIGLMAHELAHQWFGDLVTMKWWDDLWLNEGFATWTTFKVVDTYMPAFGAKLDAAANASSIMDADGLASARAIRQPVASVGQAMEAFDGITYQKGAAVLRMIEQHVGEDAFQRGVHAYLSAHAWGNATADDLFGAIDAQSSQHDASTLARAYVDRPGVPMIVVDEVNCGAAFSLKAHQERFFPLGSTIGMSAGEVAPWTVPFCAVSATAGSKPECALVTGPTSLRGKGACPIFANPDGVGYYRVSWSESTTAGLAATLGQASPATRVGILADAWASVRAGKLDGRAFLVDVLPAIDRQTDRRVIEKLTGILYELGEIVDEPTWPAFSAMVRARLAPHIARLERIPEAKLDEDERLLRRTLTYAEVDLGDDTTLVTKLDAIAKSFAAGKAVDPDYGQVAVELAARKRDPAELRKAAEASGSPQAHALALRAAAGVIDAAAVRAQLDWMLGPSVKLQDVGRVLWPLAGRLKTRAVTLAYVHDHWDALRGKLIGHLGRGLVGMAGFACTPQALTESRAFYTQKAATLEGAERPLAQALESASLCVALHDAVLPQMKRAFASSSGAGGPARR